MKTLDYKDQKHNPGVQMCNKGLKNNFFKKVPHFLISTLFILSNYILNRSSKKMLINQKLRITHHSLRAWLLNRNHQIF